MGRKQKTKKRINWKNGSPRKRMDKAVRKFNTCEDNILEIFSQYVQ